MKRLGGWVATAVLVTMGCGAPVLDVRTYTSQAVDEILASDSTACGPIYVEVDQVASPLLDAWADSIVVALRARDVVASRRPNALMATRHVFLWQGAGALQLATGGGARRWEHALPLPARFRDRRWIRGPRIPAVVEMAPAHTGHFPSGRLFTPIPDSDPLIAFHLQSGDGDTVRIGRVSITASGVQVTWTTRGAAGLGGTQVEDRLASATLPGLSGVTVVLDAFGRLAYGRNGVEWGPPLSGAGTTVVAFESGVVTALDTSTNGVDGLQYVEVDAARRAHVVERIDMGSHPVRAIAVRDVDGDGLDDVLVAFDDWRRGPRLGAWVSGVGP